MRSKLISRRKRNNLPRRVVRGTRVKAQPARVAVHIATAPSQVAKSLADRIYEEILKQIVSGDMQIGDRLPSETQFAANYKVSRAVIREALSRLHADGVVVTRRGAGTFVHRQPAREFLKLAPIGGIADLMRCLEFRIALEGEAAYLAAQRRTEEHMAAIDEAFQQLEEANAAGQLGVEQDAEFHVAIARASRNQMFMQALDALAIHVFHGMNVTRKLSLARNRKRLALVQEEHRKIVEAIRSGDEELARKAMRAHIDNARTRVLGDSAEPR